MCACVYVCVHNSKKVHIQLLFSRKLNILLLRNDGVVENVSLYGLKTEQRHAFLCILAMSSQSEECSYIHQLYHFKKC